MIGDGRVRGRARNGDLKHVHDRNHDQPLMDP